MLVDIDDLIMIVAGHRINARGRMLIDPICLADASAHRLPTFSVGREKYKLRGDQSAWLAGLEGRPAVERQSYWDDIR